MRVCRYQDDSGIRTGFYGDDHVISLLAGADRYKQSTGEELVFSPGDDLLTLLPAGGEEHETALQLNAWLNDQDEADLGVIRQPVETVQLLVPVPRPNKLFLLAGNYAKHIEEGGGIAAERAETFPYVFMKPPTTTLTNPGDPVRIPQVSSATTDWELELAIVIGKGGKGISEADALGHVAGYTVINDISDRKFRPNPDRKAREKDGFFDWLHGKWHDSFCPCGPCITSSHAIADPQQLKLTLSVNGTVRQDSSTAHQIFPVAAIIEFISSFVTLEPGDMISTGTPDGVGNTTGTYLQPGDEVEAVISEIGHLVSPVVAE
ncbi:MAG: fumarylacetoacetate hydrolase family protein [Planctomycetaceae bacterium]|nr:fumarylacetoacetate hydrolase family protein [Planctomycetaceae bacterium]MCP4811859.1 fumarylacetoacetate hydrolase family protein [Planctomycetaceae bacterium]